MPAASAHNAAARSNESLGHHLLSTEWANWAIVPAFYAALHLVGAFFAVRLSYHPADHVARERLVARTRELDPIAVRYLTLRYRADRVRYHLTVLSETDRHSLIHQDLRALREFLDPLVAGG